MSDDADATDEREFIAEHLAEARVYRRYGFNDKAWDQYVTVLERFPDNAEAHQELMSLDWNKDAATKVFIANMIRPRGALRGRGEEAVHASAQAPLCRASCNCCSRGGSACVTVAHRMSLSMSK